MLFPSVPKWQILAAVGVLSAAVATYVTHVIESGRVANGANDRDSTIISSYGFAGEGTGYIAMTGFASVVQGWVDSTYANYGLQIERTDGSNDFVYVQFDSDAASDGLRPYFEVTYTAAAGGGGNGNMLLMGCGA